MKVHIIEEGRYLLLEDFTYFSPRYRRSITVENGIYDGATGAIDIKTKGWWIHDQICRNPFFDDGTPITAWQAAQILSDILADEGRWFRKYTWKFATFLFGCHESRKNGWF